MKKILAWVMFVVSTVIAVGLGGALAMMTFGLATEAWFSITSDGRYSAEKFDFLLKQVPAIGALFIGVAAVSYVQWQRNLFTKPVP